MNEQSYKDDLIRAKYMLKCDGEHASFWMGYILGLHRGHDGELFQCPHDELMSVPNDCLDGAILQKSRGYKEGLKAFDTGIPFNLDSFV